MATLSRPGEPSISYVDHGGDGPPVVLVHGITESGAMWEPIVARLAEQRVVTVDLRGHGDSSANWPSYGMAETADDLLALLEHLGAGPAIVVATSFAPTAALWAAAAFTAAAAALLPRQPLSLSGSDLDLRRSIPP